MPHVSSKKLSPGLLEKLFVELLAILEKAHRKNYLSSVIDELLTPIEKTMVAKRLAIVLMLTSNTPYHKVADILNVSPTTVTKLSLEIEIGKYKTILKISKKEKIDLEKIVWSIMTAGGIMPPKAGRKYWTKYLNKHL